MQRAFLLLSYSGQLFRIAECQFCDAVTLWQNGIEKSNQQVLVRFFAKKFFETEVSVRVNVTRWHKSECVNLGISNFLHRLIYRPRSYSGKAIAAELLNRGYEPLTCEKGYRNHPLTEEQKESNRLKSKVHCRIEHVFGEQKMRMEEETLRSSGLVREYSVLTANISRQNGKDKYHFPSF